MYKYIKGKYLLYFLKLESQRIDKNYLHFIERQEKC